MSKITFGTGDEELVMEHESKDLAEVVLYINELKLKGWQVESITKIEIE